ncbi:MAG: acyl carrier protein [Streptococcus sp.]|nr:acyl carrier protein [Streptococcus sp.]
MSEKEIYSKIVEIIKERQTTDFIISPQLKLKEDLSVDSVDLMEFIISLEDTFKIEISDETIDHFTTLSDVVTYIHGKVQK